jgi:tetratricopeptide (TPR) repeat protein
MMSDNAFLSLSDEALEEMIASDSDVFHLDIYNELADRYWKKNELDKAALALENLISEYDGVIETGTLVNARYKQALMYFRAENFEVAYTYAAKGLTQWDADHEADYFFLELAKCFIVELRSGMELDFIDDVPEKAETLLEISKKLKLNNYIQMTYMIIAEAYFRMEQDDKCEQYFKLAEESDEVDTHTRERLDFFRKEISEGR